MFPRDQRLRTTTEILNVFRKGERCRQGAISVFLVRRPETKVTVIADKKVAKEAVVRNLVKRRLRAFLRQAELPKGHLCVRAYSGAEKYSSKELQQLLGQCLSKLS